MRPKELFTDAFRALWSNKMRGGLSMFGIAWGIVSIILMVAAGEGLREGIRRQSENFGKDIMIFNAGRTSMQAGGARAGRIIRFRDTDHLQVKKEAPACTYVMPELGRASVPVRSQSNSGSPMVAASLPPFAQIRSLSVEEGRFYNWSDEVEARRVAFLGDDTRKQLFGTHAAVGQTIQIGDFPYTVIGVMRQKDQNSNYDGPDARKIFIPYSAMLRDFPSSPPKTAHDIDRLVITPKSTEQHEECKSQARSTLGRLHDFHPDDEEAVRVWDTVENAKQLGMVMDGMKYFLGAVGLATLLLGGIGVMNVMLVSVRERTREIGVRKAVGATSRSVLGQFFVETMVIVILSGGLGLGVAYGLCALVNQCPMPAFFAGMQTNWDSGLLACGLLGFTAVLSALYPASRAASVDPIEALRHEAGN